MKNWELQIDYLSWYKLRRLGKSQRKLKYIFHPEDTNKTGLYKLLFSLTHKNASDLHRLRYGLLVIIEGTVGFPERKLLPNSSANSTVNNSTYVVHRVTRENFLWASSMTGHIKTLQTISTDTSEYLIQKWSSMTHISKTLRGSQTLSTNVFGIHVKKSHQYPQIPYLSWELWATKRDGYHTNLVQFP